MVSCAASTSHHGSIRKLVFDDLNVLSQLVVLSMRYSTLKAKTMQGLGYGATELAKLLEPRKISYFSSTVYYFNH